MWGRQWVRVDHHGVVIAISIVDIHATDLTILRYDNNIASKTRSGRETQTRRDEDSVGDWIDSASAGGPKVGEDVLQMGRFVRNERRQIMRWGYRVVSQSGPSGGRHMRNERRNEGVCRGSRRHLYLSGPSRPRPAARTVASPPHVSAHSRPLRCCHESAYVT